MLLARKGYRILVLDRAAFPSDTISTHWLHEPAVAMLRDWGLLDAVLATGCPPIEQMSLDLGAFALHGRPTPLDGVPAVAPRRTLLDAILVDAARAAGAEVRERFSVHELERDDNGRVVGIRGGLGSGTVERARLIVGADGVHSLVARAAGAPAYIDKGSLTCTYYGYWSGLPTDGVEIYLGDAVAWGAIPTNDGLTTVVISWPYAEFARIHRDVEASYRASLGTHPEFADRLAAARLESRVVGTADIPNHYRTSYGEGWALVGDAGYHKDPCTAQGITDAFRDAAALTDAVDSALSGSRSLEDALAAFQQARDAATMPMFEFTCQLAALAPPTPEEQQLFAALRDNPAQTDRFFGVIAGTVPVPDFFSPDNLERLLLPG
jgi:2-polyprenyl-6-methoxyphenol hydroxylase-like FAD-dependent oxidoreductase